MKKIFEKIVEGILACSGFVTSLTIVLIVVLLFSAALGVLPTKMQVPALRSWWSVRLAL